MVRRYIRCAVPWVTVLLAFGNIVLAAQKTGPATSPTKPDFLPAGPFFFGPGAPHPINMDAFGTRPIVSPTESWQ